MSIAFFLLVLFQAQKESKAPSRDELQAYARRATIPTALGVYVAGEKAGYLVTEARMEKLRGRDVLVVEEDSVSRSTYDGEESRQHEYTRTTYALDGLGEVLAIAHWSEEDGTRIEHDASLKDGKFLIVERGLGGESSRTVDPPRDSLFEQLRFEAWLNSEPEGGARFLVHEIDLAAESIDIPSELRYLEPCRTLLNGNLLPGHRVTIEQSGMEIEATLLSDMRFVSAGIPGVIEFRLEDMATVKKLTGPAPAFEAFSIACDERLGEPERVRYLELEVSAPEEARIPVDRRQTLLQEGSTWRIRLWRDPSGDEGAPLSEAEARRYLASTPQLQSADARLVEQARTIAGATESRRELARALVSWLDENLEPTYVKNASTALEVLVNRSGDCSEHALLFTALARALGIPSRVVGGVVYAGDELGVFAWHAWAEFHDGKHWIAVDPTWGQLPVDATHVKLDEDGLDGDESWLKFLGKLEFWVLDSEQD